MRIAVIVLNVLSALSVVAIEPIAFYIGAWGLLGPAYGDPGAAVLGVAIMAAPLVIVGVSVWLSMRRARAGKADALLIAAAPLLIACAVIWTFGPMFSGR